jgi:hypothetical protein
VSIQPQKPYIFFDAAWAGRIAATSQTQQNPESKAALP